MRTYDPYPLLTEESQLNYSMQFFYVINAGLVASKCRGIEERINTSPPQTVLFPASNAIKRDQIKVINKR